MGKKLKVYKISPDHRIDWYYFWCPVCKTEHHIPVDSKRPNQSSRVDGIRTWGFNGDMEEPRFPMSLVVSREEDLCGNVIQKRCHTYIRHGRLEFLSDCEHDYKNKNMDMLDVSQWPKPVDEVKEMLRKKYPEAF